MGGKLKTRKRVKTLQKIQELDNSPIDYTTSALAKMLDVSRMTVSNYRRVLRKEGLIGKQKRVQIDGGDWMISRELFDKLPVIEKFTSWCQRDKLVPTEFTNRLYDICRAKCKLVIFNFLDFFPIYSISFFILFIENMCIFWK